MVKKKNGTLHLVETEVVPEGASPLSTLVLPGIIDTRLYFEEANREIAYVVSRAFDLPLENDRRLVGLSEKDVREHDAALIEPPQACLVRCGNSKHIALVVDAGGLVRGISMWDRVRLVALYYPEEDGALPQLPRKRRADEDVLSGELVARALALWDGMDDREAQQMFSPFKHEKFKATIAERAPIRAVIHRRMGSATEALWIEFAGRIWSAGTITQPSRRVTEPEWDDREKARWWNHRSNEEAGQV
jgi:hypothetical protein